jgi:hypothetical protein
MRERYQAIAYDAMALENGDCAPSMFGIVVFNEIFIRHALLLLDIYCRFDHLAEARGVCITRLECLRYHVGR